MKLLTKIQEFVKQNACIILHIVVTIALSVISILSLSWFPKLKFPITIALAIAFVYFVYRAVFKNKYADSLLKAGCIIVIFIAANDLYSYDTLSALIPQLLNWNPIILSVIFVAIMIFLFIVIKLAQYMVNQEGETQKAGTNGLDDDENKKRNKESFTKDDEGNQNSSGKHSSNTGATNENSDNLNQDKAKGEREIYEEQSGETFMSRRIRSYAFAFIIVALALLSICLPIYLLYKSHINGIDMEALDFAQTFTFLANYGASGILSLLAFLLAVIVVLYIFRYIIRLLHMLLVEGDWKPGTPNQEKREEGIFPTYAFSAIVTAVIMFMTAHFTDYKVEDLAETLVSANYLAFPLTVIVIIVSFFVLLQIINSIFVLLGTITPEKIKDYLRKSEEKIGIVSGIMDMLELVIHIIMGSVIAIFGLIDFVPNFFMWMKDFVLGDAPELERKKAREKRKRRWNSEADEQKGGNGDTAADTCDMTAGNNEKPDVQESDNQKGIYIIRVAAFCFAIVSWIATAHGLQEYVFTEQSYLQAYMISFGIQAILFVFNLQLPAYFARIGREMGDGHVKKAFVRTIIAMFYVVVLLSSSLFSFVYISRSVYEDTRYNDAAVELESMYRTYLSELEQYVDDSTQVALLNISTVLSELTGLIPKMEEDETSIEELNEALETATLEYNNALVALNTAEERYNGAVATRDESNEVRWRSNEEHEQEIQDAEAALSEYESAQLDYYEKESALKKAQDAVDNYEETADMVVNDLLVEFMSASPDEDNIKELMENLNAMVLELAGDGGEESVSGNFSNELFAEIVAKNEELSLAVNKYYALLAIQSTDGEMNDLEDLNNSLENGTAIPDIPSSEDDAERNIEIENWKNVWAEYFKIIKELIQNVPEYSENTLNTVKNNYSSVEIESLVVFDKNRYVTEIDDLVRNNLTEINEVEWAWNALNGRYPAMARFSLAFALLLDLSSLLAGLFIYYVNHKTKDIDETAV